MCDGYTKERLDRKIKFRWALEFVSNVKLTNFFFCFDVLHGIMKQSKQGFIIVLMFSMRIPIYSSLKIYMSIDVERLSKKRFDVAVTGDTVESARSQHA